MPVAPAEPAPRPLLPTKPLSKMRGSSLGRMPRPLSVTDSSTQPSASREAMSRTGALSPRYFRLLEISWVSRKASHLESERTVWERRSVWMLAPLSMRICLFRASTSMTQSRREISRMRQSFSAAPRRA